ncbi:MAG: RNA polymerase insert [Candidatus Parvarchaeum acidophilus ARMAN-5]|jgi:DNA-directed RNA polymerase subunit D|uniref:DNA-directed RNA polymerase subunit Rpo3 n=1 Tax=Candidatus Parvarchaeum acidophilus ARMAN-5 TaxID=662762 RepID=D6GVN7_PARA5|nr:MAG: RNA polymerase insert [Candidatus Parvarchaeum acidophilus ARMAN-5]
MKVELLEEKTETKLLLNGCSVAMANAIRRAIINGVYTLAIDDVTIYKNTSSMFDEVLAARLGLIPIKTPIEVKGKGKFLLKLKEMGPKAVHASDLVSSDKDVVPAIPEMLIINLKDGESLELEAETTWGNGAIHTKFTPAHVYYHFYPKITIPNSSVKGAAKIASLCPVDILDGQKDSLSVKSGKLSECILCKACEDYAGSDVISISSEKDKIVFGIESWGQLSVKDIFNEAISTLEEEVKEISEKI